MKKFHLESSGHVDVLLHKLHANDFVRLGATGAVKKSVILLVERRILDGGFVLVRIVCWEHVQVHGQWERIAVLFVRSAVAMHADNVVGNAAVLFDIH